MAIDFTRYQVPGVYTESVGGPQLAVRSSVPTAVAIFGTAIGYRTARESIQINPDTQDNNGHAVAATNKALSHSGIDISLETTGANSGQPKTFRVVNPNSGTNYVYGVDYTIARLSAGDDAVTGTRDDLYTIKRMVGDDEDSNIAPNEIVQVSYRYTDPKYFDVYQLYDYDDVRDFYGEPFKADGTVQSELTLASKFAFMNGASSILTCAVDPTNPSAPSTQDYIDALDKLRDEDQIAVIVPATGSSYIQPYIANHVDAQSNNKYERSAIVGVDGSNTPVSVDNMVQMATTLSNQRIALVSPSSFYYYAPELNRQITLGGQFMAAAVAGKSVSQLASYPLTRKIIEGFDGPAENRREGEKNRESQNGLMVIEKTRRGQVQVRHGVTTNSYELLTREWSIIRQQDVMVYRIRDYLDNDGLIGMPIYDTTLVQVKASADAALESLRRDEIIRNYQNLKVRQIASLPDVLEVRYEWLPAYPLNYIVVRYSVAVLSGDITVTETTAL